MSSFSGVNAGSNKGLSILFVGESAIVHTVEMKGYNQFASTRFSEPFVTMKRLFEELGHSFTHVPCHRVSMDFPNTPDGLRVYDVVLFSDVGSDTFLLHPDTARFSKRTPNMLQALKKYVAAGGGFGMIGGYMTFQGFEAKGKWKDSPIEEILPVNLLTYDDRNEVPEGADLAANPLSHPVLDGLPKQWPFILGYNRTVAKPDATVLVQYGEDPIVALGTYGDGRTLAYTTDCNPHWAPPEMIDWEHYPALWNRLANWLAGKL